jgi:hypothetical protein
VPIGQLKSVRIQDDFLKDKQKTIETIGKV